MFQKVHYTYLLFLMKLVITVTIFSCQQDRNPNITNTYPYDAKGDLRPLSEPPSDSLTEYRFTRTVAVGDYFCAIDSIVDYFNTGSAYPLTEYILVHTNPWIIDSLAALDYYLMKERGITIKDQRQSVLFKPGDHLIIPTASTAQRIQQSLDSLRLDVNVPEFKLRIYEGQEIRYTFPVRVGQNKTKFLKLVDKEVSLKTDVGSGRIIRVDREPYFINPVDGKHFTQTHRDDGMVTEMPPIPWLETEIDGVRNGDMIHPTTNPVTLGKAWSNGCIGVRESDAWRIYYHAPQGTRIIIRYDLNILQSNGDTLRLKDIYSNGY